MKEGRLKVVFLDHCAALSGGEIALLRMLGAMGEVDRHVILAEDGPLRERLEAQGVRVEVMPLDDSVRNTSRFKVRPGIHQVRLAGEVLGYAWRLSRHLRQLQPDFVHTNSLKAAVYGGLAGRLAGIPVVCHVRDRLAVDYMPGFTVRFMRLALRNLPAAVIANSSTTMETLAPSTAAVRILGAVAYDPVSAEFAVSQARKNTTFTVGMVGRISAWKGQHVLLRAFARAFPDGGARCVIVGAPLFGEDAYKAELEALVDGLGLRHRVQMVGFSDDVNSHLANFDVLVHASTIPEPFGQVVIEGMAAGLPVVAAAAGGPSEVVIDGVNGLLYPPGDVEALAGLLVQLRNSRSLRLSLGLGGVLKAAEFHPSQMAAQVQALYRTLAAMEDG